MDGKRGLGGGGKGGFIANCGRDCDMVRNVVGELEYWVVAHGVGELRRRDRLGVGVAFAVCNGSVNAEWFGCRRTSLVSNRCRKVWSVELLMQLTSDGRRDASRFDARGSKRSEENKH